MELDSRVVDQYTDRGSFLRVTLAGKEPPYLLKVAADVSEARDRYAEDYALAVETDSGPKLLFPILDAGNTVMSAMYFSKCAEYIPKKLREEVKTKIAAAAESFGLSSDELLTKEASAAMGYTDELGIPLTKESLAEAFGLTSPNSEYEIIEDEFINSSPRGRQRLMFRAKEAGVDLTKLARYADYCGEDFGRDFEGQLKLRNAHVGYDGTYTKVLDAMFEKRAGVGTEAMIDLLEKFDRETGVCDAYGRFGLKDPVASVLGSSQYDEMFGLEKTASVEFDGETYTEDQLRSLTGNNEFVSAFDTELVDQMAARPVDVFNSLPYTLKRTITEYMNG